jgi:exonuclease SbcD
VVRALLLADTHLGFDLPFRPRISRRRRGHDFFANLELALAPALRREVDLVVHGGDLLYRTKVPAPLLEKALAPLARVADAGVPLFLVPGNHERSRIPLHLWAGHPHIHIFDRPQTFLCRTPAGPVSVSGFPFSRRIRDGFPDLVHRTGSAGTPAVLRLLCMHQTVEGSQVGPSNFTFRGGPDVVRGSQIPGGFAALLCGHIHRSQMLTHDLRGRKLRAPVIYPGSIERTSFAERCEPKHYVLAEFQADSDDGGRLRSASFVELPARPMVHLDVVLSGRDRESLSQHIRQRLSGLNQNAVVRVRLADAGGSSPPDYVSAAWLRALAPATMNVSLARSRTRPIRDDSRRASVGRSGDAVPSPNSGRH